MEKYKAEKLSIYAKADALAIGVDAPPDESTLQTLAEFMAVAGDTIFIHGDPNYDNEKRNISIEVFLRFDSSEIVAFGRAWLKKWLKNANQPWYIEWVGIFDRADRDEIAEILLSHDENRTRQRSSSPLSEMLDVNVVLAIKRRGVCGKM